MSKLDSFDKEIGRILKKQYPSSFYEFTQPSEPKTNWFEIYLKKEKQFEAAVKQIDEKMNLMLRSFGDFEKKFDKKLEYLEDKIDWSNDEK